jgi:hypothetical protein
MPNNRSYSAGDRVVFLARGGENHVATLQNFGAQHYTARALNDSPFALVEGLVTDVQNNAVRPGDALASLRRARSPNRINVKYYAEENEMYVQDFLLKMASYNRLSEAVERGFTVLNFPEEQRAWMRAFIYPVVVTSAGYQKLLTDLITLVRPDADVAAIMQDDVQSIRAKAEQYGVRFAPLGMSCLYTKWALEDQVEEPLQYQQLHKGYKQAKLQAPSAWGQAVQDAVPRPLFEINPVNGPDADFDDGDDE